MELDTKNILDSTNNTQMKGYFEDDEKGFLFVREFETHRLVSEFAFLLRLIDEMSSEIIFRQGDAEIHPEHMDIASETKHLLSEYTIYE